MQYRKQTKNMFGLLNRGLGMVTACAFLACLVAVPVSAQPGGSSIQHWGAFFGDNNSADNNRTLRPATLNLPASVAQVGSSNSTQYALLSDGTLWAWGQGTNGEFGNGQTTNSFTAPVQVQFPTGVHIAYIPTDAMPYDTGLAVDTNGNVWGWGLNEFGELCLGNTTEYNSPVELPFANVTTLAGASGHAVYDSNGTVYSCGSNWNGILGNGTKKSSTVPVQVSVLNGQNVTTLVSSFNNAGALLNDGTYYDWGFNPAGQLGIGSNEANSAVPVQVTFPDSSGIAQVAEGGSDATNGQTLVMMNDGSMFAWGNDSDSQLGDGGTSAQFSPIQLQAPTGVTYSRLASGGATSYAITSTGAVYAWGFNSQGQVGNGSTGTVATPTMVLPDGSASLVSSTANDVAVN